MDSIGTTCLTKAAVGGDTGPVTTSAAEPPVDAVRVLGLLRWTIPLHALLPLAFAGLRALGDGWLMAFLLVLHLGFPLVLVATYSRWRGQGLQMVGLVAVNHVVTFMVGLALLAAFD